MMDDTKQNHGNNKKTSTFSLLPEIGGGMSLSESVDEALRDSSLGSAGPQDKGEKIDESVKVGDNEDLHDLAARKQPRSR